MISHLENEKLNPVPTWRLSCQKGNQKLWSKTAPEKVLYEYVVSGVEHGLTNNEKLMGHTHALHKAAEEGHSELLNTKKGVQNAHASHIESSLTTIELF